MEVGAKQQSTAFRELFEEEIIRLSWNFLELNLSWTTLGKLSTSETISLPVPPSLFISSALYFLLFLKTPKPQDCR